MVISTPTTIRPRLVSRTGADAGAWPEVAGRDGAGAGPAAAAVVLLAAARATTVRSVRATRQVVRSVLTVLAKVCEVVDLAYCWLLSVAAAPAAADGPPSAPPAITDSGGRCRLGYEVRDRRTVMSGLILASSFASAALVIPIARLLATNGCSIVSLFDRINVRSNEHTIVFISQGSDTFADRSNRCLI
jgi:hypothetical protein